MTIQETIQLKLSKKEARQIVFNKLTDALVEFKPYMKKKKFESKMLKASKLFAVDIAAAKGKNGKSVEKVKNKRKKISEPANT